MTTGRIPLLRSFTLKAQLGQFIINIITILFNYIFIEMGSSVPSGPVDLVSNVAFSHFS